MKKSITNYIYVIIFLIILAVIAFLFIVYLYKINLSGIFKVGSLVNNTSSLKIVQ